jgi:PncC family amidohydrolase
VAELIRIPGASRVVRGAVVAYATDLKSALLGVDTNILSTRGPVDPEVAMQMAEGARRRLGKQPDAASWGISTTGVAGPGSQDGHPAGTVFLGFATLAIVARRREGRLVARHLAVYGSTGWLSPAEVAMLSSLPARRDARNWAARTGGQGARRAMRDFQELGSELAFLRERMARGTAPQDAATVEYAMLATASTLRGRFLPHWSVPNRP